MKLHQHTLKYLSGAMLLVISIWATLFYFKMLDDIYDSIDDGLDNYKLLIIQKAEEDDIVLHKSAFNESNYAIKEIPKELAIQMKDVYRDTLMYMQNEEDFEPVRILTSAFKKDGKYYELKVISSMVEEDDLIEDLLFALVWLYLLLLIIIILVNTVLLRKIWDPFYKILDQLKSFRLGKDQFTPENDSPVTEFKELNNAIDALLHRSENTFNSQKQFTENAAHELQTPLAIAINKLELLIEKNELQEGQSQTLGQVMEILERLIRINKSLLLLSKIDNKQFYDDKIISVNEIFKPLLDGYRDLAEYKGIEINYSESGNFKCTMNPDLAAIFISNMLKNAIIHNTQGGKVKIQITDDNFSICNSGKPTPLDGEKIFSRFYKDSKMQSGTGLGLSIVKAIADVYQLKVTYTYKDEHCMEVKLK